jgi:hypothetical protein
VQDELTNLIFPGSQGSGSDSLDRLSSALVLRCMRDLGSRYTLGALFTDRTGEGYFNRVYGFDGAARFSRSDRVTFQFLGSSTAYPGDVALAFELDHNYQRLDVEGRELYTANITQAKVIYHINLRMFLRVIGQYVDYRYNAANYTFPVDPVYRHFFSQFLFSYKLNPRTVFFLGYSDNALGTREYRLTRSDRTIFMKVSYSWQI